MFRYLAFHAFFLALAYGNDASMLGTAGAGGAAASAATALAFGGTPATIAKAAAFGGAASMLTAYGNGLYFVKPGLMYCAGQDPHWAGPTDTLIACLYPNILHYVPPLYTFPYIGPVETNDGFTADVSMEITVSTLNGKQQSLHTNVPRLMQKCAHSDKPIMTCLVEEILLNCLDKFISIEVDSKKIQDREFEDLLMRPFRRCLQQKGSPFTIRSVNMNLVRPDDLTEHTAPTAPAPTAPTAPSAPSAPSAPLSKRARTAPWAPTSKKMNVPPTSLIPLEWTIVVVVLLFLLLSCVSTLLCVMLAPLCIWRTKKSVPLPAAPAATLGGALPGGLPIGLPRQDPRFAPGQPGHFI
jgi:hypothetical protein